MRSLNPWACQAFTFAAGSGRDGSRNHDCPPLEPVLQDTNAADHVIELTVLIPGRPDPPLVLRRLAALNTKIRLHKQPDRLAE